MLTTVEKLNILIEDHDPYNNTDFLNESLNLTDKMQAFDILSEATLGDIISILGIPKHKEVLLDEAFENFLFIYENMLLDFPDNTFAADITLNEAEGESIKDKLKKLNPARLMALLKKGAAGNKKQMSVATGILSKAGISASSLSIKLSDPNIQKEKLKGLIDAKVKSALSSKETLKRIKDNPDKTFILQVKMALAFVFMNGVVTALSTTIFGPFIGVGLVAPFVEEYSKRFAVRNNFGKQYMAIFSIAEVITYMIRKAGAPGVLMTRLIVVGFHYIWYLMHKEGHKMEGEAKGRAKKFISILSFLIPFMMHATWNQATVIFTGLSDAISGA